LGGKRLSFRCEIPRARWLDWQLRGKGVLCVGYTQEWERIAGEASLKWLI